MLNDSDRTAHDRFVLGMTALAVLSVLALAGGANAAFVDGIMRGIGDWMEGIEVLRMIGEFLGHFVA